MSEFTKELLVLLLFLLLFIPVVYQGFRQKKKKTKPSQIINSNAADMTATNSEAGLNFGLIAGGL